VLIFWSRKRVICFKSSVPLSITIRIKLSLHCGIFTAIGAKDFRGCFFFERNVVPSPKQWVVSDMKITSCIIG
jgi:hypothetical protein